MVGATITVADQIKGINWPPIFSGSDGGFSVSDLPPATYTVTVWTRFFRTSITKDISILGGQTRELK
ncbi:MAG: carboxypeptidase-like regulatory domain-containing protein, partial [Candidatus Acidiferrales bacterium]